MGELRTRKRNNKWEWSFEIAKIDGKRKSMSKGGYRTKAEAIAEGTKSKAEYDNAGRITKVSNLSLSDYMEYWLENHVKINLAYNTYSSYKVIFDHHIRNELGSYKISSLGPDTIQRWIDKKANGELESASVSSIMNVLKSSLTYAVMPMQYIKENPCMYVKIPKKDINIELKNRRFYVVSNTDWSRIIEKFPKGTTYFLPLQVGYHIGTRISETYGIDLMNDIDFENKTISILRQVQYINKGLYVKAPKRNSFRTIHLGDTILGLLKDEMATRRKNQIRYGEYFKKTYIDTGGKIVQLNSNIKAPDDYKEIMPLSANADGTICSPKKFQYCSKLIREDLGLEYFHYHCLRHTHGTILAENNVNVKTIMERLGHKNISTTINRYITNTDKMKKTAVDIFEQAIK